MTSADAATDVKHHNCSVEDRWELLDFHGIFLTYVCPICVSAKRAMYRPDMLTGYTQADVDERIEPDE